MKAPDWLIIVALSVCIGIAYAGFRIEAALAAVVVCLLASWRFYDYKCKQGEGFSGDNLQGHHPDSMYAGSQHSGHSDSGSDAGGSGGTD